MNQRISIHPRKRERIFKRDNFRCKICGNNGDFNSLEVDHIIPVAFGGTNDENNLQTLCYRCNMSKKIDSLPKEYNKLANISPIDKLELVKNRLKDYKHLTYAEFKVVFTQDALFRALNIDLLYLNDLFYEISGYKKDRKVITPKEKVVRDKLINFIYENKDKLGITQDNIAEIAGIGSKTVWTALHKPDFEENQGI